MNKKIITVIVTTLVALPFIANADTKPCTIVIGASFAGDKWPIVTKHASGNETMDSRNALLGGRYFGLCSALQQAVGTSRQVSCPAVAGAMSFDLNITFDQTDIVAPGYLTQLDKGIHECTWNGHLLADSLVVTLVNDGPGAIEPTMNVVTAAKNAGINNVIVQAYQQDMPDFYQESTTALVKHGSYWGTVIQALSAVPNTADYTALVEAHTAALSNFAGVRRYLQFYDRDYESFDGVHPRADAQKHAADLLKNRI
jgi:hypothetical protein